MRSKKQKEVKKRSPLAYVAAVIIALMAFSQSSVDKSASDASTAALDATAAPEVKATAEPTPEPDTLQGWAEHVAKSVYGDRLISVSCEQVDGESAPMITINAKYMDTILKNDDRMGNFLYNAMMATWKINDLAKEGKIEYGSVYIHGRTTFVDKYGNEMEGDAAAIRVKASEAAKVNWSFSTFNAEMMPGIAVSFMIHPVIREGLSAEYQIKIQK